MFIDVRHEEAQDDAYHGMDGWSVSQWKKLPKSPEEFYGYHVAKPPLWPFETAPAMEFGTKVHARLLEPDTFAERYPVAGCCSAIIKTGKNAGAQCGKSAEYRIGESWYCGVHGKDAEPVECLSHVDALRLNSIVRSIKTDPQLTAMLEIAGHVEYSLFGTHEETGLQVRGRLDKWYEFGEGRMILDIKTFANDPTDERLVAAACLQRGYHCQAAAYLDMMAGHGKPCDAFAFIFVRTSPPFNSCLWFLNDNDVELGRRRNRIALREIRARLDSGEWFGPRHGQPNYLTFPAYAHEDATHVDETPVPYGEFESFSIAESE